MTNLYEKKIENLEDYINDLKSLLEKASKKSLSKKVKTYQNLCHYHTHFSDESIKKLVNELYFQYIDYLDSIQEDFENNFRDTYGEKIFELVMANFINKYFKLKKREKKTKRGGALPDLELEANRKTYFLECTTRDSTLISDFIDFSTKSDDYFLVAKIFAQQNKILKETHSGFSGEWYYSELINQQNIWISLDKKNKEFIWRKLGFIGNYPKLLKKEDLVNFKNWISLSRYMLIYFPEIIPNATVNKLDEINLARSISYETEEVNAFYKRLARFMSQCIADKLIKKYFSEGIPVILSISLSLFNDFKMIKNPKEIINQVQYLLTETLKKVVQEKIDQVEDLKEKLALKENFETNIRNLYAIIIDTTWYNWFPEITATVMPVDFNNYYGIIYNSDISEVIRRRSDEVLFNSLIPYQFHLSLKIN